MSAAALAHEPTIEPTAFQKAVLMTPGTHDLFLGGGRGGGKSYALGLLALRHGEQHRGHARMLYIRKTHAGCEDFVSLTRHLFGTVYGPAARLNANEGLWKLPTGATLEINQLDDPSDYAKYQGRSFSLILVDEAGQYNEPSLLDLLRGSLRAPAPVIPRYIMAANPGGAGHGWLTRKHVYKAAPWQPYTEEKSRRSFINAPSTLVDNPTLDREGYRDQLTAATEADPDLRKAWIYGDWSIARGAFFSAVLDESRVMVEAWRPEDVPRAERPTFYSSEDYRLWQKQYGHVGDGWRLFLAHDFGVSAPSVTYVVGESPGITGPDGKYYPRGSIMLLDEVATNEPGSLTKGMGYTVPVLAERIKELAHRWGIKPEGVANDAVFGRTGSSAGTIAQEFARAGVFFRRARKGERVAGWERMRRMLQDAGKADVSGLYVSRLCEYWWSTVPTLPRDPRRIDDVDSRSSDHAADACRYAIVGKLEPPVAATAPYGSVR